MRRPYELWLIWQNVETRQRYHVGNLIFVNGRFQFEYEKRCGRRTLNEAINNGYKPHLSFPDINRTYTSDRLFGPFARRLPDRRRPDFEKLIQELGLPSDCTELDLLRATGGRLVTDSYEFVPPIFLENDQFDFEFYIAGWRYYEGEHIIHQLHVGDSVALDLHPENLKDDRAVVVLTNRYGSKLGYIPAFYSGFMFEAIKNDCKYTATIERVNPGAIPQRKVNIAVSGVLSSSFNMNDVFLSDNLQLIKQ